MFLRNYVRVLTHLSNRRLAPISVKREYSNINEQVTIKSDTPGGKDELIKPKVWASYGFSTEDYYRDRYEAHWSYFLFITLSLCGGIFVHTYMPDWNRRDWARREAFLVLRERESKGLPLIDMNYIDPKDMILPSEEELLGVEIII